MYIHKLFYQEKKYFNVRYLWANSLSRDPTGVLPTDTCFCNKRSPVNYLFTMCIIITQGILHFHELQSFLLSGETQWVNAYYHSLIMCLYDNLSTKSCMASLHGFTLAFIYFYLHIQALQPNVGDNSKKNDSKRNIRNVAMSRVKIQIRKKMMKSPSLFIFLQIPTFLTMCFFYTSPCGHQMQTVGCNVIPRC